MRFAVVCLVLMLFVGFANLPSNAQGVKASSSVPTLCQYESYTLSDGSYIPCSEGASTGWQAQMFTTSSCHTVSTISFYFALYTQGMGFSFGPLTVKIKATNGGLPSGDDLTSASVDPNNWSSGSGGFSATWQNVTVPELNLMANTMYAIMVSEAYSDVEQNDLWWYGNSSGAYSGGSAYYYAGGSWYSYGAFTCDFMIWGVPCTLGSQVSDGGNILLDWWVDIVLLCVFLCAVVLFWVLRKRLHHRKS